MQNESQAGYKPVKVPNTVPLKHRRNCPDSVSFYKHIMAVQDFEPIVQSLLNDGVCKSEARARDLIDAWVQWFAVGATSVTKSYVMLSGPIDRVFHSMIVNTTWYFDFCHLHTYVYTHHDPLTAEQKADPSTMRAVSETIDRLVSAFGDDLHRELRKWVHAHKVGNVQPQSVSCTGNDGPFDIIPR